MRGPLLRLLPCALDRVEVRGVGRQAEELDPMSVVVEPCLAGTVSGWRTPSLRVGMIPSEQARAGGSPTSPGSFEPVQPHGGWGAQNARGALRGDGLFPDQFGAKRFSRRSALLLKPPKRDRVAFPRRCRVRQRASGSLVVENASVARRRGQPSPRLEIPPPRVGAGKQERRTRSVETAIQVALEFSAVHWELQNRVVFVELDGRTVQECIFILKSIAKCACRASFFLDDFVE